MYLWGSIPGVGRHKMEPETNMDIRNRGAALSAMVHELGRILCRHQWSTLSPIPTEEALGIYIIHDLTPLNIHIWFRESLRCRAWSLHVQGPTVWSHRMHPLQELACHHSPPSHQLPAALSAARSGWCHLNTHILKKGQQNHSYVKEMHQPTLQMAGRLSFKYTLPEENIVNASPGRVQQRLYVLWRCLANCPHYALKNSFKVRN